MTKAQLEAIRKRHVDDWDIGVVGTNRGWGYHRARQDRADLLTEVDRLTAENKSLWTAGARLAETALEQTR